MMSLRSLFLRLAKLCPRKPRAKPEPQAITPAPAWQVCNSRLRKMLEETEDPKRHWPKAPCLEGGLKLWPWPVIGYKTPGPDKTGELKYIGRRPYGAVAFDFYRCYDCSTLFPVIDGCIMCNGRPIELCPFCGPVKNANSNNGNPQLQT